MVEVPDIGESVRGMRSIVQFGAIERRLAEKEEIDAAREISGYEVFQSLR